MGRKRVLDSVEKFLFLYDVFIFIVTYFYKGLTTFFPPQQPPVGGYKCYDLYALLKIVLQCFSIEKKSFSFFLQNKIKIFFFF